MNIIPNHDYKYVEFAIFFPFHYTYRATANKTNFVGTLALGVLLKLMLLSVFMIH